MIGKKPKANTLLPETQHAANGKKVAYEWRCYFCNAPTPRGDKYCDDWCKNQHLLEKETK